MSMMAGMPGSSRPPRMELKYGSTTFTLDLPPERLAGVIAPFLSHSVLWLASGQLAFTGGALLLWFAARHYRNRITGAGAVP